MNTFAVNNTSEGEFFSASFTKSFLTLTLSPSIYLCLSDIIYAERRVFFFFLKKKAPLNIFLLLSGE